MVQYALRPRGCITYLIVIFIHLLLFSSLSLSYDSEQYSNIRHGPFRTILDGKYLRKLQERSGSKIDAEKPEPDYLLLEDNVDAPKKNQTIQDLVHSSKPTKSTGLNRDRRKRLRECRNYVCKFTDVCGYVPLQSRLDQHRSPEDIDYDNKFVPTEEPIASTRIVLGRNSSHGEFPQYMKILVRVQLLEMHLCGGVLISDRHILTAGHCVMDRVDSTKIVGLDDIEVTAGAYGLFSYVGTEQRVAIESICQAKGFRRFVSGGASHTEHDWAIINLAEPIKFNDHIQPACLLEKERLYEVENIGKSSMCYVMGLGSQKPMAAGEDQPTILDAFPTRMQKMRVIKGDCKGLHIPEHDRSRHCLKGVRSTTDSCAGDSGGPVLCLTDEGRYAIVGIVSYGKLDCSGGQAVFTNIPSLLEDIKNQCGI